MKYIVTLVIFLSFVISVYTYFLYAPVTSSHKNAINPDQPSEEFSE